MITAFLFFNPLIKCLAVVKANIAFGYATVLQQQVCFDCLESSYHAARRALSQFRSLKIRRTTFLSYKKFADLRISRLQNWERASREPTIINTTKQTSKDLSTVDLDPTRRFTIISLKIPSIIISQVNKSLWEK